MKSRVRDARLLSGLSRFSGSQPVCFSCRRSILRRQYGSAAIAPTVDEGATQSIPTLPEVPSEGFRPAYRIHTGVVLSRPPQITRDLSPFEQAFFFYQKRLNERLSLPFTRYFYFKKGTPADVEWKRKVKERLTPARDIGVYNPYTPEGWNDELLSGAKESNPEHLVESLLQDAETGAPSNEGVVDAGKNEALERPMPRVTEADKSCDEKSLDRMLQRSLYLLVRDREGRWMFPSGVLPRGEHFHEGAERVLSESAGTNMNTWVVGNAPIGYYRLEFRKPVVNLNTSREELGDKVFFMKARIMAGQADLTSNKFGLVDFKWLAKEEIQRLVTPQYWSKTQDMLADR